jgi:Zn-dependent membrane protease YugP
MYFIYYGSMIILIPGIIFAIWAQFRINSTYKKYSRVQCRSRWVANEMSQMLLEQNGCYGVAVHRTRGNLTDNYNPSTDVLSLSDTTYGKSDIAALGVAAHECGHAVQHAREYGPLTMRSALVPIVNFSSMWSTWIIIIGILTIRTMPAIFWVGITMIAMSALFSLITLPVEYNASQRALFWIRSNNILNGEQYQQAETALNWAARTYLVAALSAIATLIYYLGFARNRD